MMRKIQTQREIDKKKRKNQILIVVVMTSLLVVSTLGYSLMDNNEEKDDSGVNEFGINFFSRDGFWMAVVGEDVFRFRYLPSEVLNIDVNVSLGLERYSGQPLYFVNPNEGASEILNNLGQSILRYQEACLINQSCEGNLPVKDCESNLIIFVEGNTSSVYQDEGCIYIIGDSVRGADAFLYDILEVS